MIAKEFLNALRETATTFEWKFHRRSHQIRGSMRDRQVRQLFDPITAVCYARTGQVYREDQWTEASQDLGLSWIDAGDIAAAANGVVNGTADEVAYRRELRDQMTDCLMLEEPNAVSPASGLGFFQNLLQQTFGRDQHTNF